MRKKINDKYNTKGKEESKKHQNDSMQTKNLDYFECKPVKFIRSSSVFDSSTNNGFVIVVV